MTGAIGSETAQERKLLVIDESGSLEVSMRVQGLVGGLKDRSGVQVVSKLVEVEHPTENPLKEIDELQVDAVIIIPGTIETRRINQVWIITRPYSAIPVKARAEMKDMMNQLKSGIEEAFSGQVKAVGVNDDVIPAYFSTLFLREGVLR